MSNNILILGAGMVSRPLVRYLLDQPNYSVKVATRTKSKADKLFNGLSAGGKIEMPISDSPWGSYFGMFRDKYGIEWMIDFDPRRNG